METTWLNKFGGQDIGHAKNHNDISFGYRWRAILITAVIQHKQLSDEHILEKVGAQTGSRRCTMEIKYRAAS